MISLVKKNYIISKYQVLFMIAFSLVMFPILYYRMESSPMAEYLLFFLLLIITVILLNNTVSIMETSNEKAISYLIITPYGRTNYIVSKYVYDLSLILGLVVLLLTEKGVLSIGETLNYSIIAAIVLVVVLYRCVMIPVEVKFGYEKSKFIGMVSIMLLSFGLPSILSQFHISNRVLDAFYSDSVVEISLLLSFVAILCLAISIVAAVRIFREKEL